MALSRLAVELDKLDPAVPFRASSDHDHYTWARTFHSRPELYIQPQSLEEIQKIVVLARRCRRRLVVVGSGHSPSDLTCTSSWMLNLDGYNNVLKADTNKRTFLVQSGIRLHDLNLRAKEYGMVIRNQGSVDHQSIAGAVSTGTHGSSLRHGLLSQNIRSLRIVLSNGSAVRCSPEQNEDLFRAALVSLGALGIVVEIELQMAESCNIEYMQTIKPLEDVLARWETNLWTEAEFTRVWWLPYMKRAIVWKADKTDKPRQPPPKSWYGGSMGFHTYHVLLWLSNYFPRILPTVEWFVFGMQYGFSDGAVTSGVEEQRVGLLMDCLYSQFVNEWAIPLEKGPEAIRRLSAWLHGDEKASGIPFSSKGLWVHSPIEVRVSDTSGSHPRPFLDITNSQGPTLYLNATLYRPYLRDPPCYKRYYEAFEWLMKELGGKPHWAKNFATVTHDDLKSMYGENLASYLRIRNEVDPEGMFTGDWHRRYILPPASQLPTMALEERERGRVSAGDGDGVEWLGEQADASVSKSASSEESFDIMHETEAAASTMFSASQESAIASQGGSKETV